MDAYFNNVVLLLNGEGTAGSSQIVDSGPLGKTCAASGVQVIAAPWRGLSFSNGRVAADGSADFAFDGAFTIEMLWMPIAVGACVLWDFRPEGWGGANGNMYAHVQPDGGMYASIIGVGNVNINSPIHLNVVNHIAVQRDGMGDISLFHDGVFQGKFNSNYSTLVGASRPSLGSAGDTGSPSYPINGLARYRITKGVARYDTAGFTPPTAFDRGAPYRVRGVIRDASGNPAQRTVRLLRRDTGAAIGVDTQSDATTGAYECPSDTQSLCQRIVLTADPSTENDLIDLVYPGTP